MWDVGATCLEGFPYRHPHLKVFEDKSVTKRDEAFAAADTCDGEQNCAMVLLSSPAAAARPSCPGTVVCLRQRC